MNKDYFLPLGDKMVEITATEQNIEKRMKRNEDSLRDLCDNNKHTNICIVGVPEGEKRKDLRKYLKRLIVKNFPNTGNEIINQIQEAQRVIL